MLFKEFGSKDNPAIILLHGGGLSWWAYEDAIKLLKDDFFIAVPVIDGHGEDGLNNFISIEASAKKLIEYIDCTFFGKVLALAGLSLGAQIIIEILSQRSEIAEYAVIESALVIPIRGSKVLAASNMLFYGLVKQKWFSRIQAKSLALPNNMFEAYYNDSVKISKQSLFNISKSNAGFKIKESIAGTRAKAMIIVGEKELGVMRQSAEILQKSIPGSILCISAGLKHGEFSLLHPKEYVQKIKVFLGK